MCAEKTGSHPNILASVLTNKCPRCRKGNLFIDPNPYNLRNTMQMPEECPVCGQKFELQTGFYFGTGFVSYGMTVLFSGVTFALWWFLIGMGIHDTRIWWWLGINAALLMILQPVIQRQARSIWIACFVPYDRNWTSHRSATL